MFSYVLLPYNVIDSAYLYDSGICPNDKVLLTDIYLPLTVTGTGNIFFTIYLS